MSTTPEDIGPPAGAEPQHIGPYEIRGELGRGGMGVVWLAWDPRLEREVALKQLPPELARDDTVRQRFVTEARSAAKLQHPGILPLFDVGESEGLPFFVMQKVDGGDLADHLAVSGRMSLDAAAPLLRQMAAAIDHAHAEGVVHRDIKPENILLDKSGQALLTDFGIARAAESGNRGLTRTGMILGTPEYMSPEQAAGGAVDHRADLYSFGVIAYRMLTGTVPFGGDSVLGVAMQHVSAPPPDPRLLAPELSEGVARALGVMLAKEPGQRYQSASEFVERLTAGDEQRAAPAPRAATVLAPLPGVTPSAPPAAGAPRNLGLAVVAAALILLGGVLVAARQWTRVPVPSVVSLPQAQAEATVRGAGLTTRVEPTEHAGPVGMVIGQNPATGSLARGGTLTLMVSAPPAEVEVPNTAGRSQEDAIATLQGLGLQTSVQARDDGTRAGTVVEQDPAGGTVAGGSTVWLYVSNGSAPTPRETGPSGYHEGQILEVEEPDDEGLNVRDAPSMGANKITKLNVGEQVTLLDEATGDPGFLQVRLPDGRIGWCAWHRPGELWLRYLHAPEDAQRIRRERLGY